MCATEYIVGTGLGTKGRRRRAGVSDLGDETVGIYC